MDRSEIVIDLTLGAEDGAPKAEPITGQKSGSRPRALRQTSHHDPHKPKTSLSWFKSFADEFEDAEERSVVDFNPTSTNTATVNGRGPTPTENYSSSTTPMAVRLAREESERALHASERAGRLGAGRASSVAKKMEEIAELIRQLDQFQLQRKEGDRRVEEESVAEPGTFARSAVAIPPGGADHYHSLVSGSGCPTEVLVEHAGSNIALTRHDMGTLAPGSWLNDEVINLSMSLLQDRDAAARQQEKVG